MNKVAQRHVSEPSTAYEPSNESCKYNSDAEDSPNETSTSRDYVAESCLATSLERDLSISRFPDTPWSRSNRYPKTYEGLHKELIEVFEWIKPTAKEKFVRHMVCQRIQNLLHLYWPYSICSIYGSVATDLFLPLSDIDLSVDNINNIPGIMKYVADVLKNDSSFNDVILLDRSYVPIIKLVDNDTGFNVDISFNISHKGKYAIDYIKFLKYHYPVLEVFILVLKQFLASRQLNHAFTGGLSSYCLILMIIHYMFRNYKEQFYLKKKEDISTGLIGEFFINFLNYYGNEFNPLTDALGFVSIMEAILLPKADLTASMNEEICSSILCVQDPINIGTDVGRSAHNFMQVKTAFSQAYNELNLLLNNKKDCDGAMLENVIIIPESLIEFRRKINELPSNILQTHPGNANGIFGGQPPLPFPFPPLPHHALLCLTQPITTPRTTTAVYDENAEQNTSTSENSTSPALSMNTYAYAVPQFIHPQMYSMYPHFPYTIPVIAPSYFDAQENSSPEDNDYYNDESLSGESTPSNNGTKNANKLMSSNSSTTSSTDTSCTTVTPDCDSDKQRLSTSSSDSALSD